MQGWQLCLWHSASETNPKLVSAGLRTFIAAMSSGDKTTVDLSKEVRLAQHCLFALLLMHCVREYRATLRS